MKSSNAPVILFLQGPPSTFWPELARAFEKRGARTVRVNFSLGDWLYWRKDGAINYRGSLAEWPGFLENLLVAEGVTHIVYYSDRMPYHAKAMQIAENLQISSYSIEFGYLRPDWLTLERGGMGSFSHFPNNPADIRAIAKDAAFPDMEVKYTHSFAQEAFNEVVYNLTAYFGRPFFWRYEADRYYDPLFEYLLWLPRVFTSFGIRYRAKKLSAAALNSTFWLLGMQLQSDYQIRANSHYPHLKDMLAEVICSFAQNAAAEDKLLIKLHPLDNGWERWDRMVADIAKQYGILDRVWVINGGDLGKLLERAKGVIVVNSTVGLHAIQAGRPTKILGMAVYDLPGLTHQASLDDFWTAPEPVDAALVRDLIKAMAATIQVKGNFYHRAGRARAAAEIAERILQGKVNQPGAFITPPPRLAEGLRRRREAGLASEYEEMQDAPGRITMTGARHSG